MTLYDTVLDFVKECTREFDESHDYNHAIVVYDNAKKIMDSFDIEYDYDILMFSALLHDVRDHKYPKSISEKDLEAFVGKHLSNKVGIVMKIINNISFSKEQCGKRDEFTYPYILYLDAISDSDRLQALGSVGIKRCEMFVEARGGDVPEDVVRHCHEKLLRLLPEKFIKTEYGRKLAEPLHQEVLDYVNKNTGTNEVKSHCRKFAEPLHQEILDYINGHTRKK